MRDWVPVSTVNAVVQGWEALGLETEPMLAAAGLDAERLTDPFAAIPQQGFEHLWALAAQADGHPLFFARSGAAVPFGAFGLLDHLVSSATTVGEAFRTLERYFRLVTLSQSLRIEDRGREAWVFLEHLEPDLDLRVAEIWCLSLLLGRFRAALAPQPFEIRELWATLEPPPEPVPAYARAWDTRVRFGAPHCGLCLSPTTWDLEIPKADLALHQALATAADRLQVRSFLDGPTAFAVRARLEPATEPEHFDARGIAASLGLSPRSLQRRLAAEGFRFRDLVQQVRERRAKDLLRQEVLDVGQVARTLGYREQSSFNRAFRRWTGLSPRAWRRGAGT